MSSRALLVVVAAALGSLSVLPLRADEKGVPATKPEVKHFSPAMETRRRAIIPSSKTIKDMPIVATCKRSDLYRLHLQGGRIVSDPTTIEVPDRQTRVAVEGDNRIWVVSSFPAAMVGRAGGVTSVSRYDYDQIDKEDGIYTLTLNFFGGFTLASQSLARAVNISDNAGGFVVSIFNYDNQRGGTSFQAPNLSAFVSEHPAEFRDYVVPLLRDAGGLEIQPRAAGELYAVFDQIPADPQVTQKIQALLPALDNDDFNVRESASADLAKLGDAGVLAAMRLDKANLTPEQRSRIKAFIDQMGQGAGINPKAALEDPWFLLGALQSNDPNVAAAARQALEKLAGHSLKTDLPADASERQQALQDLWYALIEEVGKKSPPAGESAVQQNTDGAVGGAKILIAPQQIPR